MPRNRGILIAPIRVFPGDIQSADLRCRDFDTIPVGRIVDGDKFASGRNRERRYGMDTPGSR